MNSPYSHEIQWVDSSAIDLFLTCGRRFKLEALDLREPAEGSSHHLRVGGAFAQATDTLRREGDLTKAIICLADSFPFDSTFPPKTFSNTVLSLILYDERFSSSPLWEVAASEFSFTVDVPGHEDISFVGRVDALLRSKTTGLLFVLDDKTTGRMGPKWGNKWPLRGQFIGYVWALRHLGFDVQGVVCRGVKISSASPEIAEFGPFFIHDHLLSSWEERLSHVVERMKSGPFLPAFNDTCAWCPWHSDCRELPLEKITGRKREVLWDPVHGSYSTPPWENGDDA